MYACERCHGEHECPAGRHERLYWARCELCGDELNCFDCVLGPRKSRGPAGAKRWGIEAYLHTGRVHYKRGEEA
jgi:hypothetical protein